MIAAPDLIMSTCTAHLKPLVIRAFFCLLLIPLSSLDADQSSSDPPATESDVRIVQSDLTDRIGKLLYLDPERVVLELVGGDRITIRPDRISFIEVDPQGRFDHSDIPETYSSRLWLTDGTYYRIEPRVTGDRLFWKNWSLEQVDAPLDRIRAFNRQLTTPPISSETEDLVVLENGDRIVGLIDRLGRDLHIEREDGTVLQIPFDRVASFVLLNEPVAESGPRIWSNGSDKFTVDRFQYEQGIGLIFSDHSGQQISSLHTVDALIFDPDRVLPLASLDPTVSGIEGQLRYHYPRPRIAPGTWPLDAPSLTVSGPIRLQWDLPQPGMGFLATALLPSSSRSHGNLELIVSDESGVLLKQVIDGKRPIFEIRLRIPGRRLVLELHEQENGPLQDSVRLEQAVLLAPPGSD